MSNLNFSASTTSLDKTTQGHQAHKVTCPSCRKPKVFVRYYDRGIREYFPEDLEFGRCDREQNCGHHSKPYEWIKLNRGESNEWVPRGIRKAPEQVAVVIKTIDREIVQRTLAAYHNNTLIRFLSTLATPAQITELLSTHYIGTTKDGSALFWQLDRSMRPRTAQKIRYMPDGHRDKSLFPTRLFKQSEGYSSCLFGEHQLYTIPGADKMSIALVESEKTAVICALYLPTINNKPVLWMATSGANGLTDEKALILAGRNIILVPDFSFHARATWGQVPMRKLEQLNETTGKMTKIPHPLGELIPDYTSTADRLRAMHCTVTFFDPYPNIHDGTDIADQLVKMKVPQRAEVVRRDEQKEGNSSQSNGSGVNFDYLTLLRTKLPLTGEVGFKVAENGKILCDHENAIPFIEKVTKNPHVMKLMKGLSIFEGTIQPGGYDADA